MSRGAPRGRRVRLARGIYRDKFGIAGVVTVNGWRKECRFPRDEPLANVRQWQGDEMTRLRSSGVKTTRRGRFAADVDVYLERVRHLAGWISLRSELRQWVKLFEDWRRDQITTEDVEDARKTWLAAGVAPKTVNNRVMALNRLWHKLDGRRAVSPGDDLLPLHIHRTPIVVVPNSVVTTVYEKLLEWERTGRLRNAKTRARFMVLASTGRRPSEIARAEPADVDLPRRVWIPRDGKGGHSPGVYLNDDMLAAWTVFTAAQAWGSFREGTFVRTMRRAGWPPGVRLYSLRHTVGIEMSEAGVPLDDVGPHLGHKRMETTRRHYVPVLNSRMQIASEAIDRRFNWRAESPHVASNVAAPLKSAG